MATCTANMMDVPESQRLITVSLSKIAASRSQKGGINLHKNLLVATVLTKARAAYMIQHITANKQRAAMAAAPPSSAASSSSSSSPACVEMKEQKAEPVSASSATSSPSSSATPSTPFHSSSSSSAPTTTPQSVIPRAETSSVPEGAADSCMQVAECEDKENTPPPPPPSSSSPCRDAPSDCEKRLQGEPASVVDSVKEGNKQQQQALSARTSVSHSQQHSNNTRDFVSRPSSTCCLLKRRRAMDRDHENVSAPKVRIVEARVSLDTSSSSSSTPEPMQCDSPQISNLVNIFNTSFSGLSGAPGPNGELSVRNVGQSILSVSSHKLSDNLTCAKEIKAGLDSLHQPLVLSV